MCRLGVAYKTQCVMSQSQLKVSNQQWENNVTCTAVTDWLQGGHKRTYLGLRKHNAVFLRFLVATSKVI